jgi:hypothetical protein
MKPGETFRKAWILFNDGSMPWDSNDIQLVNLSDGIEVVQQPTVPITAPHERAVITVDYKSADEPGTYESKWILAYRQQTFGPMIWCSIEVSHSPVVESSIESIISSIESITNSFNEFEFIEVPLPACFDLSKPYQPDMKTSDSSSLHVNLFYSTHILYSLLFFQSSFIMSRSDSIELPSAYFNTADSKIHFKNFFNILIRFYFLVDHFQSSFNSDSDSLPTFMNASSISTLQNNEQTPPTTLIDLRPSTEDRSITPPIILDHTEEHQSTRLKY